MKSEAKERLQKAGLRAVYFHPNGKMFDDGRWMVNSVLFGLIVSPDADFDELHKEMKASRHEFFEFCQPVDYDDKPSKRPDEIWLPFYAEDLEIYGAKDKRHVIRDLDLVYSLLLTHTQPRQPDGSYINDWPRRALDNAFTNRPAVYYTDGINMRTVFLDDGRRVRIGKTEYWTANKRVQSVIATREGQTDALRQ